MLAVDKEYRRLGLGRKLVKKTIEAMKELGANEIMLETEETNLAALRLYECKIIDDLYMFVAFGFVRDKKLQSYYLNGNDAFKLKLYITS